MLPLAQLLDRSEQAIQKIRTKTEYKQAELRLKQRLNESKTTECKSTSEKVAVQELNEISSIQPTPNITSCNNNQLQTPKRVRIKRKLPDLANISVVQNSSLTTRQLL